MFCAGLLLSIADLLSSFELQPIHLLLRHLPQDQLKVTAYSSRPSAQGTRGGQTCLLASPVFRGRAARQVAASTIRRLPALFNRNFVRIRFCADVRMVTEM